MLIVKQPLTHLAVLAVRYCLLVATSCNYIYLTWYTKKSFFSFMRKHPQPRFVVTVMLGVKTTCFKRDILGIFYYFFFSIPLPFIQFWSPTEQFYLTISSKNPLVVSHRCHDCKNRGNRDFSHYCMWQLPETHSSGCCFPLIGWSVEDIDALLLL